ncbi:MAG TPA: hypothetical protein VJ785_14565, partial [Anaerolineales bacterium]|nr:hypothetical protein [Anaerolineales bacterium]
MNLCLQVLIPRLQVLILRLQVLIPRLQVLIPYECSAKLSVTYAPCAVPGGVFRGNPAPGTAQGALEEKLSTL